MRFAVVGAGAMGCLYGAKLCKAGQEVILIVSRENAAATINKEGVRMQEGEIEEILKIPAYLASDYTGTVDAVLLFTKSTQSEKALASVKHMIGKDTWLISFQNGIGNDTCMKTYTDADHIIIGTTNFPSDRLGDGQFRVGGTGITAMMTLSGSRSEGFEEIFRILETAKLNPQVQPEIFRSIWEKVAFNAALNSLCSIALTPQGYMGETEEGKELAGAIVREVCSVAHAKGIPVRDEQVLDTVYRLLRDHYEHCPSMLQDVLHHRQTEIGSINGAVVREAESLGIEVPVTKVLYQLVSITQQTYEHRLVK